MPCFTRVYESQSPRVGTLGSANPTACPDAGYILPRSSRMDAYPSLYQSPLPTGHFLTSGALFVAFFQARWVGKLNPYPFLFSFDGSAWTMPSSAYVSPDLCSSYPRQDAETSSYQLPASNPFSFFIKQVCW